MKKPMKVTFRALYYNYFWRLPSGRVVPCCWLTLRPVMRLTAAGYEIKHPKRWSLYE